MDWKMMSVVAPALMVIAASPALAADHSIGVWKRDLSNTTYADANPNPISAMIMTRTAIPGGLKIHSVGNRADGTKIDYTVEVKYDGKDHAVTGYGSVFDTIAVTQIDADHFPSITKKGKYHMRGMTVISNGGKTMTITNEGTDAAGHPTHFEVTWQKQ